MKKVLVTGATGFVGSHILESILRRPDIHAIAACRDPSKLLHGFDGEIRQGNLLDTDYIKQVTAGVDVICHAAAWTSAWSHARESERLFLAPTTSLIDAAIDSKVGRFIFLSSTSVGAPNRKDAPMQEGDLIRLKLWPHLLNVARIEKHMRESANEHCQMTVLRVGLFTGRRYGIGLLPLLAPRLKTHLVPWVAGGRTGMPIIAGEDIGEAFALAALAEGGQRYHALNIIGPEVPSVRKVISFLSSEYGLPKPHFDVPFRVAYLFARLMEALDPIVPWEPLVTRSIVHLLEETGATNDEATSILGFYPTIGWQDAIRMQMDEMARLQKGPMKMAKPIP